MVMSIDNALTVQDRIRLKLNEFGEKHIPVTIEQLSSDLRMPNNSVYQALHRLRSNGEIEFEKTETEGGRDKIVGINVIKLEPSNRTYKRAADRSGRAQTIRPALRLVSSVDTVDGIPVLPETTNYLQQKLAVEEMKNKAIEAGLDPAMITFEPNPLAEESVTLLKLYTDLRDKYQEKKTALIQMSYDLEAERRNVDYYKGKVVEETDRELRLYARSN